FDLATDIFLIVEPGRRKNADHQISDIITAIKKSRCQCVYPVFIHRFIYKIPIDFSCDKYGGLFLGEQDLKNILSGKIARFSKKSFNSIIMLSRTKIKFSLKVCTPAC